MRILLVLTNSKDCTRVKMCGFWIELRFGEWVGGQG